MYVQSQSFDAVERISMAGWTEPEFTRSEVKRAGRDLRGQLLPMGNEIVNNWRSSHSYPLNHFFISLKQRARKVNVNSVVSQRLKRLNSIHAKLVREPSMQLTTMQDITGCRAILPTIGDVYTLANAYLNGSSQHEFDHIKNYLKIPKSSGYRSYHLIYRYKSNLRTVYEDMRVEIQLRSSLQHAWSTAVETVDLFTQQALKSSRGQEDWARFFVVMSSYIARKENSPEHPDTPPGGALIEEIRHWNAQLGVIDKLLRYRRFRDIIGYDEQKKHAYVLLRASVKDEAAVITTWGFSESQLEIAQERYYAEEAKQEGEVVLVAASRMRNIKRAFPNFFASTDVFIRAVRTAIE